MSQDEELDAIANIIRDQLAPLPYKNMFPEKQEQVREIQQLIATLIREARIDELEDLQIKSKGNKFTPFEYHYYINNRITELTNQQKGEQ